MDDRKNQNREPENGSGGGPKNRQTILIILICLLVSLMVARKNKKIDMVEALKANE